MDIDLVYLWVDGNDPKWLKKKNSITGQFFDNSEINSKARFINNDELKYSLRSVEKNAPWLRNIFIITDEQVPDWLNINHSKIKIIDHKDVLPNVALPCFNSSIIEHFLYKIPGLSEHFLYANDDMFFNRQVTPDNFFTTQGQPIVRLQFAVFGKWINAIRKKFNIHTNVYRKTIDNSALLIEKKFGKYYSGTPHHNVDAYLKSDYQQVVEEDFKQEIMSTISNHTRSENDVQRIIYLYHALAAKRGKLRFVGRKESARIRLHKSDYMRFITKYNPTFFCLNDSHHAADEDRKRVKPFLEFLFPEKSSFEK